MHSRCRAALVAASFAPAFLAPNAGAQTPPDSTDARPLSRVVITATRSAVPAVTAATTVISGAELRDRGITHVADALREVPGLALVQSGSFGAATSLYLRGGESNYTRVLVDGVPINDPGGDFDFSQLTTEDVERIEIVRGPASVLYGSDAVSGVIQIFTRDGRGPAGLSVDLRGGNFGTVVTNVNAHGGDDDRAYALAAGRYATDGIYDINNRYRHRFVSGSARLTAGNGVVARLLLRYADDEAQTPTDGSGAVVDTNALLALERTTLAVQLSRDFGSRADASLQLASHTTSGGFDDRPDGPSDTLGFYAFQGLDHVTRRRAELTVNYRAPGASVVTGGISIEGQSQNSLNQSESEFGNDNGTFDASRTTRALFVQAVRAGRWLSWNAGARLDANDAFGTFGTYRAGVAVTPVAATRLRAALGTAFREPTFFQNFATGFARGNPDLDPEESTSAEIGLDQHWWDDRLTLSATWFRQRFRNIIEFTFSPPQPTDPNYFNIARARSSGVELEFRAALTPGLRLDASHTELETRVEQPGFDGSATGYFRAGARLLRRPDRVTSAGATVRLMRADLGVRWNYFGDRDDVDFGAGERITLPAYSTVDLSARLPLATPSGTYALSLRIANALDESYEAVAGFPSPGRLLLLGVTFSR